MNLVDMRSKFLERTAGLAGSLTDVEVDAFLNGAYQYGIAADIPGGLTEGVWTLLTSDGTPGYDYADNVYEVRHNARIGTSFLSMYFRKDQFDQDFGTAASSGEPYAALFYGRRVTFYPTPDNIYTVYTSARLYPSAGLTSAGLVNHNHAMAVVCEAVREFLIDQDQTEKAATQAADLGIYLSRVRGASLSRARERRARLSF